LKENDTPAFKPGDRVTLNEAGLEFFEGRRFPAQIGAVYSNILAQNTEVVKVSGETVWLKFIKPRFPLNQTGKNCCGVRPEHLRRAGEEKGEG
jgi:hypothetical protein